MKVTVDTNFFISATQWDYSVSHKLLILMIEKEIPIVTTKEILEEFFRVLMRDFQYDDEEASAIIGKVLSLVHLIKTTITLDIIKDDPDDNKILECALESESKYIITYDKHLLNLKEYNRIRIIKPEEARAIF